MCGPVCFAAINAKLKTRYENSSMIKYADDNTIVHLLQTAKDDKLQMEFDHLQEETHKLGMVLNSKKTLEVRITTKRKPPTLAQLVAKDGSHIEVVGSTKLLGCVESNDMTWNKHVESVVKQTNSRLHLLTLLKIAGTDRHNLQIFYNSKIRSLLAYAYPAICNMTQNLLKKLERIERRAYIIIGGDPQIKLRDFLEQQARNVIAAAKQSNHRLHGIFLINTRKNSLVAPVARTSRLRNSIYRFV